MQLIDRPSMPPRLRQELAPPWVRDIELNAQDGPPRALGGVVARQPRFRFVDDPDAEAGVRLVPETAAAERLLRDPRRQELAHALLGLRQLEPNAKLTGVALGTSANGTAAHAILAALESGTVTTAGADADEAIDRLQAHADDVSWIRSHGSGAEYDLASGWMLLGPKFSSSLLRATDSRTPASERSAASAEAGAVLAHEAAHAVTPPSPAAFGRIGWIEEATADLMLELPGARARIAETLGLEQAREHASSGRYYDEQRATLSNVLSYAGLDVRNPEQAADIRSLLQDRQLGHVPRRIADAIIDARGLPPTRRPALAEAIANAHADGGATLERLVRSAQR
jgi:hypothetical protein